MEELFLSIRNNVSIQRIQIMQPLGERAAIYRNKFVYSFKLSIGGIQSYQLSNKIESPNKPNLS